MGRIQPRTSQMDLSANSLLHYMAYILMRACRASVLFNAVLEILW